MIAQLTALHRIKTMKRDQALKALQVKRAQVVRAEEALRAAAEAVRDSARTRPAREDAVYAGYIGRCVDQGDLDELRGRIVQMDQDHQLLVDGEARAAHVKARLETELAAAAEAFRRSERVLEKYTTLRAEALAEVAAVADHREESEVEDLFARARRSVA